MAESFLPAKKRKESRDFSPNPANTTTTTYCLPAKKRIWAIQPSDLNPDIQPTRSDHQNNNNQEKNKILDPISENEESCLGIKEKKEPQKHEEESLKAVEDDGVLCLICEGTDGDPSDPIVFCDGCDVMVHTTCYGYPLIDAIPDGDWFCAKCLASKTPNSTGNPKVEPFSCCLCPMIGGALKPTTNGKWAHLVCALFVPEVYFEEPNGRQGINISKVPTKRWKQSCYVCKTQKGCVMDCSEPKCPLAFHVTCGLKEELCIEYSEAKNKTAIVAGFCRSHSDLWMKQQQTGKFKIVARD